MVLLMDNIIDILEEFNYQFFSSWTLIGAKETVINITLQT